jgi:hypothetical protein
MINHPARILLETHEIVGHFQRHESAGSNWYLVPEPKFQEYLEGLYKTASRGEVSEVYDFMLSTLQSQPKDVEPAIVNGVVCVSDSYRLEYVDSKPIDNKKDSGMPIDATKFDDNFHIWVAYHLDWSEIVVFLREIDALRYAVANGTQVKKVVNCQSIRFDTIETVPEPM